MYNTFCRYLPPADSNEKYIIKSGIQIKANKVIFNNIYNHSSRHTISKNIQYKIESFKQTRQFSRIYCHYNIELTTHEKITINKEHTQIEYNT